MPQIINCSDCGRKLRVPDDLLGKKVKCPGCGVKFAAQVEAELDELEEVEEPPPRRPRDEGFQKKPSKSRPRRYEEEEEKAAKRKSREEDESGDGDSEPQRRKPKKREIYKGWERVRSGVNLVAISIWIMIGGFVAVFLLTCVIGAALGAAAAPPGGTPNGPFNQAPHGPFNQAPPAGAVAGMSVAVIAIAALMVLLYLAYTGTQMTGLGFCMGVVATPRTKDLKILAIASFSLAVAGLISRGIAYGANFILGPQALFIAGGLTWLMMLLYLAEFVCFLFFMRGVALVMRRDDLARAIVVYMITLAVIIGLSIIAYFILMLAGMAAAVMVTPTPGAMRGAGQNVGGYIIVGCAVLLLMVGVSLTLFIRFVFLLYQVRSAVDHWLNRN